jgi:hypothetical protein
LKTLQWIGFSGENHENLLETMDFPMKYGGKILKNHGFSHEIWWKNPEKSFPETDGNPARANSAGCPKQFVGRHRQRGSVRERHSISVAGHLQESIENARCFLQCEAPKIAK